MKRHRKHVLLIGLASALCLLVTPVGVCHAGNLSCAQLTSLTLPDATITSATELPAASPAYCEVVGVAGGEIGFRVKLPLETASSPWNGKFFMYGNSVYGGSFQGAANTWYSSGAAPLQRGYATAETDMGHTDSAWSASWALGDRKAEITFGGPSVHRTVVISKSIIAAYYGAEPSHSYFIGCSRGGAEAMYEAQSQPRDFDGIVAGSPQSSSLSRLAFVWNQQLMWPDGPPPADGPTLPRAKVDLLSSTILNMCDANDGLVDGIINNPLACNFSPDGDLPVCSGDEAPDCFTQAQKAAIKRIFDGPSNHKGQILPGLPPSGVENYLNPTTKYGNWPSWVTGPAPAVIPSQYGPNGQYVIGSGFLKYFVYADPSYDINNFNFETDIQDIVSDIAVLDATKTNFQPFKVHGGKFILYNGWGDAAVNPLSAIQYYEDVVAKMGRRGTDDFMRLYMQPGVCHCLSANGPDVVDWLGTIEKWVEQGIAPDTVVASGGKSPSSTTKIRPLCAYPKVARYNGAGDPNDPASWTCE